ncbi:retrotransposon protein, putative, ty1-copia subclass [Tanacetum coccineum]
MIIAIVLLLTLHNTMALESAARILNMVPTKKVEKTPYEVWHVQCPKLSLLKSLGHKLESERDDLEIDEPQSDINPILELPPNGKTVGSKWLFKKKTDMDGVVHTYKARLVAKGYTQTPRIDYEETFSPVADIRAIRILIAIAATLSDFHMENSKRGSIPMQEKLRLSKSQGASTPAKLKRMQNVQTPRLWSINVCKHSEVSSGILGSVSSLRRSHSGYEFVMNGVLLSEECQAKAFRYSSAEAEYIAAFDASKEAVWVRKFISGLGVVPTIEKPINMYCDNTGAIAIANESGITKGARHFRAKVHYSAKLLNLCDKSYKKVHTDDNLADPFTKALAFPKHSEHTRNIGMLPASSLM